MEFILQGEIPCKKNRYGIKRDKKGDPIMYVQNVVKKWTYDNQYLLKSLFRENRSPRSIITDPVALSATFYVKRDKDLDNMLNTLQDCIEGIIIENDNQIHKLKEVTKVFVKNKEECKVYFKLELIKK